MLIDSHCHLHMLVKDEGNSLLSSNNFNIIKTAVLQAQNVGVKKIVTIATRLSECHNLIALAKRFDGVFVSLGIHPCDATDGWKKDFEQITKLVEHKAENKIVAMGEAGLDFYHKPFSKERQLNVFKFHIEVALAHDLPLVIHCREATEEVLQVVEEYRNELKGVFHCFNGDVDIANIIVDWGFYIGVGGSVSYPKNEALRDVVQAIPLERILLETDAPFLPPQQFRGKQNLPEYLTLIAEVVAQTKKIEVAVVEDVTSKAAEKLFGI